MAYTVNREIQYGVEVIHLENDFLRADILAGKGGELYALVYKPQQADLLLKTPVGLSAYRDRDLSKDRLKWYSELFTGGWSDVLPMYARYKEVLVTQENAGIAATLPWRCEEIIQTGDAASIKLRVELPVIPMEIEKVFTLRGDEESEIRITEKITNTGDAPIRFSWVQHTAFGGDFLDADVIVRLPSDTVIRRPANTAEAVLPLSARECSVAAVPFGDDVYDVRRPLPEGVGDSLLFAQRNLSAPRYSLYSPKRDLSVTVDWDQAAYPYLRGWYSNGDLFTVALEPSDYYAGNPEDMFTSGAYTTLEPGKTHTAWVNCAVRRGE